MTAPGLRPAPRHLLEGARASGDAVDAPQDGGREVLEGIETHLLRNTDPAVRLKASSLTRYRKSDSARFTFTTSVRRTACVLFSAQLIALVIYSAIEYRSYGVGRDFGTHAQAWAAIAHGDLNPWVSLYQVPFWKNNGEFLFWPLALFYYIYPHAVDLLWIQDALVVATEVVAFFWIGEILKRSRPRISQETASFAALGVGVALVANPWCYETLAFDYHSQASTALFALLGLWAFSSGRTRQLKYWVPLTLLSAGLGGLAVAAMGISGVIAGRATRKLGIVLIGAGTAWFILMSQLGAVSIGGDYLQAWYGYLVHSKGHLSMFEVLQGLLQHPLAALHIAASRWDLILLFLLACGTIGVVWPWALPMALVVFGPSAVNQDVYFLLPHAAFQTWPVLPLVFVGSVALIVGMTESGSGWRNAARWFVAIWIAALVPLAIVAIPQVPNYWLAVSGKATADLSRIQSQIPHGSELIVSEGVIGRFAESDGSQVYDFFWIGNSFPITRRHVVFVLTIDQGVMHIPTWQVKSVMAYLVQRLGAREVGAHDGVFEFTWVPSPILHNVVLA